MNTLDDITIGFEDLETKKVTQITLAYLETGPEQHNHHFVQLWVAMYYLINKNMFCYNFETGTLVVGKPEHHFLLDTKLKDNGVMNVRKIVDVFVTYFFT